MVQTECRIIRQMKEDKLSMVLLPLLALLMAIQVTVACECEEINWELTMCPGDNRTVFMGGLRKKSGVVTIAGSLTVLYEVVVEKVYKQGPYNLTWLPENRIVMFTPENCSPAIIDKYGGHMISGFTDAGGILHSNTCSTEDASGFFYKPGRENMEDILWGDQAPKC